MGCVSMTSCENRAFVEVVRFEEVIRVALSLQD